MFLYSVKRINGENYGQPLLRDQLEYFRGLKEVFCLLLGCIIAAKTILLKNISDHITLALKILLWLPLCLQDKGHTL